MERLWLTETAHKHAKASRATLMDTALVLIPVTAAFWLLRKLFVLFEQQNEVANSETEHKAQVRGNVRRNLRHRMGHFPPTNKYEELIMADMVFPEQLEVGFDDIGGLAQLKEQILETVILPLQHSELFDFVSTGIPSQRLVSPPKGVLFYGPPGTGKTMMAKAIAKSCEATFINLQLSTLQNKWFGESQKLIRALFSVARKFAPSIIFIDEIDMFLRERTGNQDHEAVSSMKAEFMSLWDGLLTEDGEVLVLGATNRPFDIDRAFLRRLPRTFLFDLPCLDEREAILRVILSNHRVDSTLHLTELARATDGYCASDLRELCKYAAMIPIREVIRDHVRQNLDQLSTLKLPPGVTPRPLSMQDCFRAMDHIKATGTTSYEYQRHFQNM